MEHFTQFVSNVASSTMGNDFVSMFGVAPDDPDNWLKTKGIEVGREVMGKLMHAIYASDNMEPPVDAIVTRSLTPADMVTNSGLGGGKMASILAPLVAGVVSAIQESGVQDQILRYAQKRVTRTIEEHSESIAKHGESLGAMVVDGLAKVADGQAQQMAADAQEQPQQGGPDSHARDFSAPRDVHVDVVDENAMLASETVARDAWGGLDVGPSLVAAVMKPVARGVNLSMKKPGMIQKLVDSVSNIVPLEKIKESLKTTLYPQYTRACTTVAPHMSKFGGLAGAKVIEFLHKLAEVTQVAESEVNSAKEHCIKAMMESNEAVERDLVSPLLKPFMTGVLGKLAEGGWKSDVARGAIRKLFASCLPGSSASRSTPRPL